MIHLNITHDRDARLWCVPAAIAIVTGHTTAEIHRCIRAEAVNDRRSITGVFHTEFERTMRRLGWRALREVPAGWGDFKRSERPRLAALVASMGLGGERPAFVSVADHRGRNEHMVVVYRGEVHDNASATRGRPAPVAQFDRGLFVSKAWEWERIGPAAIPAPPAKSEQQRRDEADARRLRALAARHGVGVEFDRDTGLWWVHCPASLEDDDPLEGDHHADDLEGLERRVHAYIDALQGGYLEAVTDPALLPHGHQLSIFGALGD